MSTLPPRPTFQCVYPDDTRHSRRPPRATSMRSTDTHPYAPRRPPPSSIRMQSLPKPASVPPTPTTRTQSWATSNPRPASRPYTTPNTPSWRSPAAHTRASYSSIPALTPLPSGPEATAPSTLNDKLKHAQQQIWEINNALACGKDITPAFDSLMSIFPPTMFEGRKHTMAELEVERIIQVVRPELHRLAGTKNASKDTATLLYDTSNGMLKWLRMGNTSTPTTRSERRPTRATAMDATGPPTLVLAIESQMHFQNKYGNRWSRPSVPVAPPTTKRPRDDDKNDDKGSTAEDWRKTKIPRIKKSTSTSTARDTDARGAARPASGRSSPNARSAHQYPTPRPSSTPQSSADTSSPQINVPSPMAPIPSPDTSEIVVVDRTGPVATPGSKSPVEQPKALPPRVPARQQVSTSPRPSPLSLPSDAAGGVASNSVRPTASAKDKSATQLSPFQLDFRFSHGEPETVTCAPSPRLVLFPTPSPTTTSQAVPIGPNTAAEPPTLAASKMSLPTIHESVNATEDGEVPEAESGSESESESYGAEVDNDPEGQPKSKCEARSESGSESEPERQEHDESLNDFDDSEFSDSY